MAIATDLQVQNYVDQRIRPISEQIRNLVANMNDIKATIDDVYAALQPANNPTWTDTRDDGPPHLMSADDVLAINTIITDLLDPTTGIAANAQYPIVEKACVNPVRL